MTLCWYISHPYTGDEEKNREEAAAIQRELQERHETALFVNPLAVFQALEGFDYERVMACCLRLLSKCDRLIVTGRYRESEGCKREIEHARRHGIPVFAYDRVKKTCIWRREHEQGDPLGAADESP